MAYTFQDITGEVQDALARNDAAVTTKIAGWVNRRMRQAANKHDFHFMRSSPAAAIPIDTVNQSFGLPSDFKGDIVLYLLEANAFTLLQVKSETEMLKRYSPTDTGKPQFVSIRDTTFLIWPPHSDQTYTCNLLYWQYPAELSGTQTNWFTANAPKMLIAGGMAEGYGFIGASDDATYWEQKWEELVTKAMADDGHRKETPEDIFTLYGLGVDYRSAMINSDLSLRPDFEDR